jgi:co-chaperonin GroES (HSP10)
MQANESIMDLQRKAYKKMLNRPAELQAIKRTVIVEVVEDSNTTASGIVLQGTQERNPTAQIVSVGPQCDCGLEVGDCVVLDWNRVGKMNHNNKTYYVTDQSNVLAVFLDQTAN